jgi:hypothetical protein
MKKVLFLILVLSLIINFSFAQSNPFAKIDFVIGEWKGIGSGFGNNRSKIESSFLFVMNGKYIEVKNESHFEPTEEKPEGEHHIDHGFISFDNSRKKLIYRQFNNEGYINTYLLNESSSTENSLIFETENIENFVPGGKARFTIKKISDSQIETTFDVSFPNKAYTCFGTNNLNKK